MRVVGYVRERPAAVGAEPAFAQGERLRRWADEHGHELVAVCRDGARAEDVVGPGFDALLALLDAGVATTVVVASPQALGDTTTSREVVLWDLEGHGATVAFTTAGPADETAGEAEAASRRVREVLDRLSAHRRRGEG